MDATSANPLECLPVEDTRESKGRRLRTPSRDTGESVRAIAYHGEIVRNRFRLHSELGDDASLIAHNLLPSVELNDAFADNTLAQIFVRRANENLPTRSSAAALLAAEASASSASK